MHYFKSFFTGLLIVLCCTTPVSAGSFSEAFKKFVLGPEAEAYSLVQPEPATDALSRKCMNCHNGSRANHITVRGAGQEIKIRTFRSINHPIGMSYRQVFLRRRGEYRPRASLNPAIRFIDGQVGCTSCHLLKSQGADTAIVRNEAMNDCTASRDLTVGPKETDLCLACHIK